MGIPTKFLGNGKTAEINALPIRAYVKIWDEWFRDQNVDNPAINISTDATVNYTDDAGDDIEKILQQAYTGGRPLPVSRFHDYFSSCLPSPQRASEPVRIPMSGNAPIKGYTTASRTKEISGRVAPVDDGTVMPGGVITAVGPTQLPIESPGTVNFITGTGSNRKFAWLGADLSEVNSTTVNQLRQAFQVQKYFEELARGGSRYREQIYSLFRTRISDKTVQVPEYLGGDRVMINVNQVVQTSATDAKSPQGNVAAVSVTGFGKSAFTKSFEEHGWVIGVCCVRHDHTYQQGIERMWSRKNKLDFYFPVFANLGEQAVLKKELYASGEATDEEAFGYQEAWSEYRMKPNRVCGLFRSNANGTLDSWHYADNYDAQPALSQEWMKEGKAEIQRTLAIQNEPQFIMDILVKNNTTRPMPMFSVPGLIDHH